MWKYQRKKHSTNVYYICFSLSLRLLNCATVCECIHTGIHSQTSSLVTRQFESFDSIYNVNAQPF